MNEDRKDVIAAILTGLIGLAAVGIQYAATSQSFRIEAKAWAAQARSVWDSWQTSSQVGERFAAWYLREESSAVIADAERITREVEAE